uniref:Glutamate-rich WD repeat-containing protein 1 n=1 Tax=Panstrongylus megistus TaxID=65343 RepID=A0A069DTY3_9HEMI
MSERMEDSDVEENEPKVYLPGRPLKKDELLVHDPSAYLMLHEAQTGAPCLSFDIIPDGDGDNRTEFPLTVYLVAGTQAETPNGNSIIVMKVSNLVKTLKEGDDEKSESSDESDSDDENFITRLPKMETALIRHQGTINRIRTTVTNGRLLAAVWSELGRVTVIDLKQQLLAIADPSLRPAKKKKKKKGVGEPMDPLQVFTGHDDEGYGLDWSSVSKGVLASGDCKSNIFVWLPVEAGWTINSSPLSGHTDSVEDLQWSPNEPNVLASCSVDRTIRIWDTREHGSRACKLTVKDAHKSDINVLTWNRREPFIISGGDDGFLNIWDLRNFETNNPVAILKHHTKSVTTVEWSPHESSIFASGGEDDQIALWDLAVERDDDPNMDPQLKGLPSQLLFIHQGQNDIKELHWHAQVPGLVISTANSGFNFFKTISVE